MLMFFLIGSASWCGTIVIPYDKATIQEGIDVAESGDTVLVTRGEYSENINYSGKTICIMGAEGKEVTVLRPANANISTVTIAGREGEGTELSGFTITGGNLAHTVYVGNGASALISNNIFSGNIPFGSYDYAAVAMACDTGLVVVKKNIFYDNGGISCVLISNGKVDIRNNTFDANYAAVTSNISLTKMRNNIITGSGGIAVLGSYTILDYNDLWDNAQDYG